MTVLRLRLLLHELHLLGGRLRVGGGGVGGGGGRHVGVSVAVLSTVAHGLDVVLHIRDASCSIR